MRASLLPCFLAGLLAAILFVAVLALGLGFLFLFLPTLPLFWLGLSNTPKEALLAAGFAALLIAIPTDLSISVFFILLAGLPAFYISKFSIMSKQDGDKQIWFPIGQIFSRLTLYAAGVITLIALYYALRGQSLETLLAAQIRTEFKSVEPEYANAVETLAERLAFLVFSMGIWLWGLALYGHAWLVNRQLAIKGKNIRPDFAIAPFVPVNELLFLLALSAFASLAAGPVLAFLGKILLVGLLLPYFFLGASLMHGYTQSWPSRRFFLFFVYFLTLTAFWPALILAAIGLSHHIKYLSAKLNSTRS